MRFKRETVLLWEGEELTIARDGGSCYDAHVGGD